MDVLTIAEQDMEYWFESYPGAVASETTVKDDDWFRQAGAPASADSGSSPRGPREGR